MSVYPGKDHMLEVIEDVIGSLGRPIQVEGGKLDMLHKFANQNAC